ncbi:hypothetical protein QOT17_003938 [Balamuthia mandrillaris]
MEDEEAPKEEDLTRTLRLQAQALATTLALLQHSVAANKAKVDELSLLVESNQTFLQAWHSLFHDISSAPIQRPHPPGQNE